MPINQYGEDPEAVTNIDLDAAEAAFKRRELRTGKSAMTREQIAEALRLNAGAPQEDTLAGPPEQIGPVDIRQSAGNAIENRPDPAPVAAPKPTLDQTLAQPNQLFGSAKAMFDDLVIDKMVPPPIAFGIIEERFNAGDPSVTNLQGIDELMRKLPGWKQRFAQQSVRAFAKPLVAAGDLINTGLDTLESAVGIEPRPRTPMLPGFNKETERQIPISIRPGYKAMAANMAPELVGNIPAYVVAGEALTAGLAATILKLPRYAEAAAWVAGTAEKARFGKALIEPGADVAKQLTSAYRWSNFGGQVGSSFGIAALNKDDVAGATINATAMMAAFGLGGKILGKAGQFLKIYNPNNLSKVVSFISRKSGIPGGVIASRMQHFGQIEATLTHMQAPDSVMKTFYDGVPESEWIKGGLAKFFGKYLAKTEVAEEEVNKLMGLLPENVGKSVRNSWWNELLFEGKVKPKSPLKGSTGYDRPIQARTVKIPVGNASTEYNGAYIYPAVGSKINMTPRGPVRTVEEVLLGKGASGGTAVLNDGSKHEVANIDDLGNIILGNGKKVNIRAIRDVLDANGKSKLGYPGGEFSLTERTFVNPYVVKYNSKKETWAEAVIKSMSRPTLLGKQALYSLNRYATGDAGKYDVFSKELAMRILAKSGHHSVFVKGNIPEDKFFIDLLGYKGGEPSEIVAKIEKQIQDKADKLFANYPSVLLPILGAGALLGAEAAYPEKSEAIDFPALRKLIAAVGAKAWDVEGYKAVTAALEAEGKVGTAMALNQASFARYPHPTKFGVAKIPYNINELVDELESIHKTVAAKPEGIVTHVRLDPDKFVQIRLGHTDIESKMYPGNPEVLMDLTGTLGEDGLIRDTNLEGFGPNLFTTRDLLKVGKQLKPYGIRGWDANDKGTGAHVFGPFDPNKPRIRRSKAMMKFGVPIAIGYSLYDPDESQAAMLPGPLKALLKKVLSEEADFLVKPSVAKMFPEKAVEHAERVSLLKKGVTNFLYYNPWEKRSEFGTTPVVQVQNAIAEVAKESPVTSDLFTNVVKRKAALGRPVTVDDAVDSYARILDDLKKPFEIREHEMVAPPDAHGRYFVFHGTPAAFEEFDPKLFDDHALYGPGVYTTHDPHVAGGYSMTKYHEESQPPQNVRPMKIKDKLKFFDVDAQTTDEDLREFANSKGFPADEFVEANSGTMTNDTFYYGFLAHRPEHSKALANWELKEYYGYDGITHIGGRHKPKQHRVWIVFNPEHLETAHGYDVAEHKAWAVVNKETTRRSSNLRETLEPEFLAANPPRDIPGNWSHPLDHPLQRTSVWAPQHGYLEYNIGHPLGGDIGKIGGYIDPWDRTWYVNTKEAEDAGIGYEALLSLAAAATARNYITGLRGNFSKLALVVAATAAATILGTPEESQASPWDKLLGKTAMKGVADAFITSMNSAPTREAAETVMNEGMQASAKRIPSIFPTTGQGLFAAGATAPRKIFKEPFWRPLLNLGAEPGEALTNAPNLFKLPAYAVDHPYFKRFHAQYIVKQEQTITGEYSVAAELKKIAREKLADIPVEKYDELETTVKGLVRNSVTGKYEQTLPGVDPKLDKAARWIKEEVDDKIFELHSGINPKAPSILEELNKSNMFPGSLDETPDTWRKLRFFQNYDYAQGGLPKWKNVEMNAAEQAAMERTKGMLNWQPWHDLDTAKLRGSLTRFPVKNEQAQLEKLANELLAQYPNGMPKEQAELYKSIGIRLADLEALNERIRNRRSANLNYLPGKHYWGPISEAKEIGIPIYEKQAHQVVGKYIDGALAQGFFNEQLYHGKTVAEYLRSKGQNPAAEYTINFINTMRGVRSLDQDVYWASRLSRIFRTKIGVPDLRRYTDLVLKANFIGKLALNPSYPLINLTQPLLTGAPITGVGNMMTALPQVISEMMVGGGKIFKEAAEQGVFRHQSQFAEEAAQAQSRFLKVADWLPSHTEKFNRALVYQAGKLQALGKISKEGKLPRIPGYLEPYFDYSVLKKGDPEEFARAWGAAVTRSTQFILGPEGRSLSFSGGAPRRIWGQFRSFQQGYANLLLAAAKDDKKVAAKLIAGLALMGGANAVLGDFLGGKIINLARKGVAAAGGDPNWVPEDTPIGKVFELMGISPMFQLAGAANPLNLGTLNPVSSPERFIKSAGGPTIGSLYDAAKAGKELAFGSGNWSRGATGLVKPFAPTLVSGIEALHEAGMTPAILDDMNYRGGIYGPTGNKLVQDRPWYQIAARGLNLQPSVSSQRKSYQFKVMQLMEEGNTERAIQTLQEARDAGFIFTKRDVGNMRSVLAKQRAYQRPNVGR